MHMPGEFDFQLLKEFNTDVVDLPLWIQAGFESDHIVIESVRF